MNTGGTKVSSLRLLLLAPSDPQNKSPFPAFLEALTGSAPSQEISSYAGYTLHPPLSLKTKYYKTNISIWCDELPPSNAEGVEGHAAKPPVSTTGTPDSQNERTEPINDDGPLSDAHSLEAWQSQMLSTPAGEVRSVIGGIVLILPVNQNPSEHATQKYLPLIESVHALREAIEDDSHGRDIATVVLLQSQSSKNSTKGDLNQSLVTLEEQCQSERGILGWDFVAWDSLAQSKDDPDMKNKHGERMGIARVLEILETVDWNANPGEDAAEGPNWYGGDTVDDSVDELGLDRIESLDSELREEMTKLKASMSEGREGSDDPPFNREGEDMSIQQMQALMDRVVQVREAGANLPKDERELFAKREIQKIMKDLG